MSEYQHAIPGILVITHGIFGEELIKSAEMIVGAQENVKALSLLPGMDPADLIIDVQTILDTMPEGSLIMSDLFGGTPSNVSAAVASQRKIAAVAGVNLCMLIEALSLRFSMRGEELAEAVIQSGKSGCKNILTELEIQKVEDDSI
ncbi:PTS sugar transporter subunit IIA [Anaerosinus massiliensis]|uniref:PTS sugar transporter subunit IIA n=1 Tax=Massilibacillus massiliensis TaxID=1806837 RepID=UPI000DA6217F|nr:PTS sugar transporter subunit IIA [Massilibacillus massiliensis]